MNKPSNTYKNLIKFIEGKITEEELFSLMPKDSNKMNNRDWLELLDLKKDMILFRDFLLALSVQGRFKILLRRELLGMSENNLYLKYGISSDKLRVLKGQYKRDIKKKFPPSLRPIQIRQNISNELLANLAIFFKVPISWIQIKKPEQAWSVDHFKYIPDAHFSLDQFYSYLDSIEVLAIQNEIQHTRPNTWVYDIRGIILQINETQKIHIRVAIWERGGFIVEVFSKNNPINDFEVLKKLLKAYGPLKVGYVQTVIKDHKNIIIVAKSRSATLITPIEFLEFN